MQLFSPAVWDLSKKYKTKIVSKASLAQTAGLAATGPTMEMVDLNGERYFKMANYHSMRPFFMTIVSDANHWMYISSTGGLTAGRKNPEFALFPYYTDDKITESADVTGSKSLFQVQRSGEAHIWEPFTSRSAEQYNISRNLYKSIYGNKIIFEEINHSLQLSFRYQWSTSKVYGFVRHAALENLGRENAEVVLLDGIQNIMPHGVPSDLQRSTSNLVDAYKRNELEPESGLGIYALSAIIVDKAEPSEALKANVAWSFGLEAEAYLLSSLQLPIFRSGQQVQTETDIKGERGSYFVSATATAKAGSALNWGIVANVNQTQAQVISLAAEIKERPGLLQELEEDIAGGTAGLAKLVGSADGMQCTADKLNDTRHFSNVLFNIMRGGIFDDGYLIELSDFLEYLHKANAALAARYQDRLKGLGGRFSREALETLLLKTGDPDLIRLGTEYLPLKFSRRHGDPSRPWNYFSINTQSELDGSKILDYEGNWRDLFQNWEALAYAYPDFITGMIFKFLNASTFDGYNPYRVTKGGFDWEIIEPDDPWSYIGYWGDHQIIYLQKFLEIIEKHQPGKLQSFLGQPWFVYAAVPYVIKPYEKLLEDPQDTIAFDHEWDAAIRKRRAEEGADGALLRLGDGSIHHVTFLEKVLATVLAKVSNLIPGTGIWMNTQRPEWNDANNALVGNGVSMVTLYYLRRFMHFLLLQLQGAEEQEISVSAELARFFQRISEVLASHQGLLSAPFTDQNRKAVVDALGQAASDYREEVYEKGFSGKMEGLSLSQVSVFAKDCLAFIDHAIKANRRPDGLYHAYNLMAVEGNGIARGHLSEMLEGQVAVLSAGCLKPEEALSVLNALKNSALFREDQYSYILYPNKELPGFLHKNTIPAEAAGRSALIQQMLADGAKQIVEQDIKGGLHFNGNFKNAKDLAKALDALSGTKYGGLASQERQLLLSVFEEVFNHKAFTGRSGTFFAYEGLGSIYWHMVSKLLLAVQECCLQAMAEGAPPEIIGGLLDHYYEIQAGIGVHKPPGLYGAFPTDAYSHTPQHRGAQQPGMTGQVKEDILSRIGEMGVEVLGGKLCFSPRLLRKEAFLSSTDELGYIDVEGQPQRLPLEAGQLAFTYCNVPIVYTLAEADEIRVQYTDGKGQQIPGKVLTAEDSRAVFGRAGKIARIEVLLKL